jgi:hypothetical protein
MTQTLSSEGSIPQMWILIDSQSSIDIFCNGELLTQIRRFIVTIHIKCNAGVKTTNMQGYLSRYGCVRYCPVGIANILSLSRVKETFRITYDSVMDNAFMYTQGREDLDNS